jgi:hypothetical protein
LAERLRETTSELKLIDPSFGLWVRAIFRLDNGSEGSLLVPGVPSASRGRGVDRDAVQPGCKGGLPPEIPETTPNPNPGLLGDIGCKLMIVGKTKRESVNLAAVPFQKLGVRPPVPGSSQIDEFVIIWLFDTQAGHLVTGHLVTAGQIVTCHFSTWSSLATGGP